MNKLILDNIIFSLQYGGGASVVWSEHISRLLKDNRFDVSFLEFENNNIFRKELPIPKNIISIDSNKWLKLLRYFDVNSNRTAPYVFHSSHYRIDKCKYARNVTTVHDFVYEYYVKGFKRWIHSAQKWNSIRKADKIICISESTKRDLLHFLPDIKEDRIEVVYNGVDDCYHPILSEQDYKLVIPFSTGEYILYVGCRHTSYKNFRLVVDVCKTIKKPLIIVGGEPVTDKEASWLREQLGNSFHIMRGISNVALNELYNRAFVVLYPSFYEGFGIPVVESQRAGTPVICFKRSSIPEVAGDTILCMSEYTVDAVIDIIYYLEKEEYRRKEIEHGLHNSQRFSWNRTYQQTTDIYLSLIGNVC